MSPLRMETVSEVRIGYYARYTSEAHRSVTLAFPELGDVLVEPTYEEASDRALLKVTKKLAELCIATPVRFVHHPHNPSATDPLDYIGSWGWKQE